MIAPQALRTQNKRNAHQHYVPPHGSHRRQPDPSKPIFSGRVEKTNSAQPPRMVRETNTTIQRSNNYLFSPGFGKIVKGGCGAFLDWPTIRDYLIKDNAAEQVEQLHGQISSEMSENLVIYGKPVPLPQLVFRGMSHFLHLRTQFYHECNVLPDYYNHFKTGGLYQQLAFPGSTKAISVDDFPQLLSLLHSGHMSGMSEAILIDQFSRYIAFEHMKKGFSNPQPKFIGDLPQSANLVTIFHTVAGDMHASSGGEIFHYAEFVKLLYELAFRSESLYFEACNSGSRKPPRNFTPNGIRDALKSSPHRAFAENVVLFALTYISKNKKEPLFKNIIARAPVGNITKYATQHPNFQNMRVAANDDRSSLALVINCWRRFTLENMERDITPPSTPPPHLKC